MYIPSSCWRLTKVIKVPSHISTMDLRTLVSEKYDQIEKCYGHCEEPATSKFLTAESDHIITGYSCHSAYLSRIIVYSESLSIEQSVSDVSQLIGKVYDVKEEDIRVASRYPWDLGLPEDDGARVMMVAYWTQNYRRTKNDDPNRNALFLCESCRTIFPQPLSTRHVLCPGCTSERQGP